MPPAGRPRSSTLDRATRQQLDELDALMQRMLALPVDPPEEPAHPPRQEPAGEAPTETTKGSSDVAPNPSVRTPACTLEQDSSIQTQQPPVEPAVATNEVSMLSPAASLAALPARVERMDRRDLSARDSLAAGSSPFAGLNPPRTLGGTAAQAGGAVLENRRPPRIAWPLYPLLWINWAFDQGTVLFGPLGRGLRGPKGRTVFGGIGLLLLAAALAWLVLDGMGWTW